MTDYWREFFKIIKDNLYVIATGKYIKGDIDLNTLGNLALLRFDQISGTPAARRFRALTAGQKRAVRDFYAPWFYRLSVRHHRIYSDGSEKGFSPAYIPQDIFMLYIDRYFSDRAAARYIDNKCYYYRFFSNVRQPELVAMRVGNSWLDGKLQLVPAKRVRQLADCEEEIVVKRAVNSEAGSGVYFLQGGNLGEQLEALMRDIPCDTVIQRPIRQHATLAALHRESVNTIRVVSLLTEEKVKIYAASVKIGRGESRTDNAGSGGLFCRVHRDGRLGRVGVLPDGTTTEVHPELGYRFADLSIAHMDRVIRLVKEAHGIMGNFRLIAWDVTVDEAGHAVLVEANLSLGGIKGIQMSGGPMFGADTKKILNEVFSGQKKHYNALF